MLNSFRLPLNDDRSGVADVSRMLQKLNFIRPHALQFGPDGALYVIEWGSGFGGNNADSGLYRIDYIQGNRAPIAQFSTDKTSVPVPLTVAFDSTGSRDPDSPTAERFPRPPLGRAAGRGSLSIHRMTAP